MFRSGFGNDPFFGDFPNIDHMFMDPFGQRRQMGRLGLGNGNNMNANNNRRDLMLHQDPFQMMMSNPFSLMESMMGNMNRMFGNMDHMMHNMSNDPNAQVFSSSTVMSYSNTGDGAPKIYQASTQTKQLPGGIKETRKTVKDSERGIEKVALGHHIGDKAHVIERQKLRDGQMEEIVNLENLDDNELEAFDREFEQRVQHGTYNPFAIDHNRSYQRAHQRNQPIPIEDGRKRDKKKSKSKQH